MRDLLDISIKNVGSINSEKCITILKLLNPNVIVVNGTRLLSPELLSSCNAVFLNIHCGRTPAYRGVHGAYWALVCGDFENVGVTIHVVDSGIDTGQIVFQGKIKLDKFDNFVTYPFKQYATGIPLMKKAILDVLNGCLKTYNRNDLKSKNWSHPTIYKYFRAFFSSGAK